MSSRSNYVPQPENRPTRRGASVYAASRNYATNTNVAQLGAAADVSQALAAALTSRTGGRFRAAGSISGTATAADQITATLEVNINGGGWTAIATQLVQVSAAAGARWAASFDALSAAVTIGQTIDARVRAVDATNPAAVVAIGQATVNLQELPG